MLQPLRFKKVRVHIDGHGACWEPNIYEPKRIISPNGIRWGMDCVEAAAHERQVMCR